MSKLRFKRLGEDQVRLTGIDSVTAACLLDVPNILQRANSGPARERLCSRPSLDDEKLNEEWDQFVAPELERLFASAGEILAKDIMKIGTVPNPLTYTHIVFPLNHCDAWLTAINTARIILGAEHTVTERDTEDVEFIDPTDPKQQAMFRMDVLGDLLFMLVHFSSGEQESPNRPEDSSSS